MHTFEASDGTIFNFNSGLSGDVTVLLEAGTEGYTLPGAAMQEFMLEMSRRAFQDFADQVAPQQLGSALAAAMPFSMLGRNRP